MKYTIYKTVNQVNGKFYVGKHQTAEPNDSYLGSGRALRAAISKYGRDLFLKEILHVFDNNHDMNEMEKSIVNHDLVNDPMSYNMSVGGEGGPHFSGRKHKPESIAKMITTGPKHTIESKRKISESNKRRIYNPETGLKIAEKARGRKHSDETKAKISESLRRSRESRTST